MKLLLDTNVFLWVSREPKLLSPRVTELLQDPFNERYVSVATVWEMQIKHSLGKLPLPGKADLVAQAWMRPLVAKSLPIDMRHLRTLYELPFNHRDPFDRMLLAQAMSDDMMILSADEVLGQYSVPVIW